MVITCQPPTVLLENGSMVPWFMTADKNGNGDAGDPSVLARQNKHKQKMAAMLQRQRE